MSKDLSERAAIAMLQPCRKQTATRGATPAIAQQPRMQLARADCAVFHPIANMGLSTASPESQCGILQSAPFSKLRRIRRRQICLICARAINALKGSHSAPCPKVSCFVVDFHL
jgi:hypothetical protein